MTSSMKVKPKMIHTRAIPREREMDHKTKITLEKGNSTKSSPTDRASKAVARW